MYVRDGPEEEKQEEGREEEGQQEDTSRHTAESSGDGGSNNRIATTRTFRGNDSRSGIRMGSKISSRTSTSIFNEANQENLPFGY